ncbi:unnamed protein product [Euphydryas editha]|uniref:Uncharacterized protein n=1 Tax=Euphydryas editha TaxID=104508 RepID=A0AAU9UP95_EUPED|nr:unnamed protein product [Euphydryas editha]
MQLRDVDVSEVEDHVEIEDEVPSDSSANQTSEVEEVIGLRRQQRRIGVISSSDSEAEAVPGISGSSASSCIVVSPVRNLRGKNGHKWCSTAFELASSRTQARNIVHVIQGPANNAMNITEVSDCFSNFITADMIHDIVLHTNEEIALKNL